MVNIENLYGEVIFSEDVSSTKECLEIAVKKGANLKGANLKGANLEGALLYSANLEGANLEGANLKGALLYSANLKGANLEGALLYSANLEGANLEGANLEGALLYSANLEGANLEGANLKGALLSSASLQGASLQGAFLYSANLKGANLEGALLPHFLITPETGDFFAFKKLSNNVVVKVLIPAHAARTNSLIGRKCRASEIKVVEVLEGEIPEGVKIESTTYGEAVYAVGETVKADKWDGDIRVECTHGIHFFMTLREAQEWY